MILSSFFFFFVLVLEPSIHSIPGFEGAFFFLKKIAKKMYDDIIIMVIMH